MLSKRFQDAKFKILKLQFFRELASTPFGKYFYSITQITNLLKTLI